MLRLSRLIVIGAAVTTSVTAACSKNEQVIGRAAPTAMPAATADQVTPAKRDPGLTSNFIDHSIRRPLAHLFIPPRAFRSWLGEKVEAYNPTAEDDVRASSWFTHRNGRRRMTPSEIIRGPGESTGPDTSDTWTVVDAKVQGVTPGFTIEDATGARYLIKFDPPEFAGLATAAEVISSRLFYAAGYNVPDVHITVFDPSRVTAAESLKFEDPLGRKHPVDDRALQEILRDIPSRPDGRIRAVASTLLRNTLGPFNFEGTRQDDPADTIPHQHRRELRGLYALSAWLNHLDIKQNNTLDVLINDGDRRYVRHYLIDFGSTLGSRGVLPQKPRDGVEYDVDLAAASARWLTLGVFTKSWERYDYQLQHPSIGYFSADLFDPGSWKPLTPNPALLNSTVRDNYWGAKLVAAFDEEQIRAAVSAGQLGDPQVEEILVRTIMERRRLTLAYWLLKTTPLEELEISPTPQGSLLGFQDLAVAEGFVPPAGRQYQIRFDFPAAGIKLRETRAPPISGAGAGEILLPGYGGDAGFWEDLLKHPVEKRLAKLEVRAIPAAGVPEPRSVRVYLLPVREGSYRIVGRAY